MDLDPETASLDAILRLQDRLSEIVRRRFARTLGLVFTDIVGSTAYVARSGDEAGRRLHQRHADLVEAAAARFGGRVVDTAGDGAFSCFPTAEAAARALDAFFAAARDDNAAKPRADELLVRAGLHLGEVLTDGGIVSGEAVNLAARLGQLGAAGEVRATREALRELPNAYKLRCRRAPPVALKGFPGNVETFVIAPPDRGLFPVAVRVAETGDEIPLPEGRDTLSFGRLAESDAALGNDVVLAAPTPDGTQAIGRFHFELRRRAEGYVLRRTSSAPTEVDGATLAKGDEAPVRPGTVVRVARVLTLTFLGPPADDASLSTVEPA